MTISIGSDTFCLIVYFFWFFSNETRKYHTKTKQTDESIMRHSLFKAATVSKYLILLIINKFIGIIILFLFQVKWFVSFYFFDGNFYYIYYFIILNF